MLDLLRRYRQDVLVLATAIGLIAAFAAPWLEFRGIFQAWRIVEWHTFWRGESAYLLGDVVAPGYPIWIEYAQSSMRAVVLAADALGAGLALWHVGVTITLSAGWIRSRRTRGRVAFREAAEIVAIVLLSIALLLLLAWILSIPSNLSLKVDFRSTNDLPSSNLVWSEVTLLPVGPLLAVLACAVQIAALGTRTMERAPVGGANRA